MAKAKKTEKINEKVADNVPVKNGGLRDVPPIDFTFEDKPLMAYVRLNSMCVVGFYVDFDNAELQGVIWDDLNGTTYSFNATIE